MEVKKDRVQMVKFDTCVGGSVVRFLLEFLERWFFHIWLVGRMKFASPVATLGRDLIVYPLSPPHLSLGGDLT